MGKYYYLASALPPLRVGSPSDLPFSDFVFDAKINLSRKDYAQTEVIRRVYDLHNLRLYWEQKDEGEKFDEELDHHGNFDEYGLEEALLTETGFPDYVYDFLGRYESRDERVRRFPELLIAYYANEIACAAGFLKDYLIFEREWRLVMVGFRAKQIGRDLAQELQFEDADDDLVRQLLAQRDAEQYEPPVAYRDLKEVFQDHSTAPLALYQALSLYRFDRIEAMLGTDVFSINRILGYLAQLIIVEKWMELDQKKGLQIVDTIVKEAS